jgi:hypothetical protein
MVVQLNHLQAVLAELILEAVAVAVLGQWVPVALEVLV